MNRTKDKKVQYVCQSCGHAAPKWMGRCPDCHAWNTFLEETVRTGSKSRVTLARSPGVPLALKEIRAVEADRSPTGMEEMDRVLGGGIVPSSLILVGGDPGIGKSTLLMQAAFTVAHTGKQVLYISGEESGIQIKLRADRLETAPDKLLILCETGMDAIAAAIESSQPDVVIVDSIQTMMHPEVGSVPGSVGQVRECTAALMAIAKNNGPAIFLVGHVTKEGTLAGPRILEHLVDTVLYFEGDPQHGYRILRTIKNRFGPTNEVGVFEMGGKGLIQIGDPSKLFLKERHKNTAGSAIAVSLEGSRPLLVEIQALLATSYFGMPQRRVSGLDYNRCCLMLAVLERRAGFTLGSQDVFLSIAGGLAVSEPAMDLAVAAAIVSSLKDKAIRPDVAVFGEIGLGGELRAVTQPERRCQEAAQMGFGTCIVPQQDLEKVSALPKLECLGVNTITDALAILFE
ncbi:DNA repair protein RadA [bacterium]|nr:DNA repair protein RadA [bacterium]